MILPFKFLPGTSVCSAHICPMSDIYWSFYQRFGSNKQALCFLKQVAKIFGKKKILLPFSKLSNV